MQSENKLVLMLFAALIYLNLRYIMNVIPTPDPFYDGSLVWEKIYASSSSSSSGSGGTSSSLSSSPSLRHAHLSSAEQESIGLAEGKVAESIEFAKGRQNKEHDRMVDEARYDTNVRGGGGGGGGGGSTAEADGGDEGSAVGTRNKKRAVAAPLADLPDQVHDHTLHYPPWTHKASLHISRRTLMNRKLLCETLKDFGEINAQHSDGGGAYFGSVVIDAGWWDPSDMYAVDERLVTRPAASAGGGGSSPGDDRCLLCAMARACDATVEGREVSRFFSGPKMLRYTTSTTTADSTSLHTAASSEAGRQQQQQPTTSVPVLLWSSAMVPTTDIRYKAAALQGYFVHTGDTLDLRGRSASSSAGGGGAVDDLLKKAKQPHRFVWRRSETDYDGRSFHIEGSLIDWSNPKAVAFFSQDARSIADLYSHDDDGEGADDGQSGSRLRRQRQRLSGFAGLFDKYHDVHGFRLGGVDAVLKTIHHAALPQNNGRGAGGRDGNRVLGHKGHYSAEAYSKDYYRVMGDCGRRVTTTINNWHRKLFERGELEEVYGGGAAHSSSSSSSSLVLLPPPTRDFVVFARAVDSHDQQHTFQSFAPPDAAAMAFTGDHELSYRDLRESGLNTIHAAYRCYSAIGTIVGARHRTSIHSLQHSAAASAFSSSNNNNNVGAPQNAAHFGAPRAGEGGAVAGGGAGGGDFNSLSQKLLALEDGLRLPQKGSDADNKDKNAAADILLSASASAHEQCDEAIHSSLADQWFAFGSYLPGLFVPDRELHRLRSAFFLSVRSSASASASSTSLAAGGVADGSAIHEGHVGHNNNDPFDPHFHSVSNGNLLALTADHNALTPYYSANAMQSFLFDVTSVHVCTRPSASFQQYQNPHGNPYCPIRYVPHFNYKLFKQKKKKAAKKATAKKGNRAAVPLSRNSQLISQEAAEREKKKNTTSTSQCPLAALLPPTLGYERNVLTNRDHFPHVLFDAPVDDYQFAIGPHLLAVPRLTLGATARTISFPLLPPTMTAHAESTAGSAGGRSAPRDAADADGTNIKNDNDDDDSDAISAVNSAVVVGYQTPFIGYPNPHQWLDARQPYAFATLLASASSSQKKKKGAAAAAGADDAADTDAGTTAGSLAGGGAARGANNNAATTDEDADDVRIGADRSEAVTEGTLSFFKGIRADLSASEVGIEGRLFLRRGALLPLLLPTPSRQTSSSSSPPPSLSAGSSLDPSDDIIVFATDAPQPTPEGGLAAAAVPFTFSDWRGAVASVAVRAAAAGDAVSSYTLNHTAAATGSEEGGAVGGPPPSALLPHQPPPPPMPLPTATAFADDNSDNSPSSSLAAAARFSVYFNYTPSTHIVSTLGGGATSYAAYASALLGGRRGGGADPPATPQSQPSSGSSSPSTPPLPYKVRWAALSMTLPLPSSTGGGQGSSPASPSSSSSSSLFARQHHVLQQRCWCNDDAVFGVDGVRLEAGETVAGDDGSAHQCREVVIGDDHHPILDGDHAPPIPTSLSARHAPLLSMGLLGVPTSSSASSTTAAGGDASGAAAGQPIEQRRDSNHCVVVRDVMRRWGGAGAAAAAAAAPQSVQSSMMPFQQLQLFVPADEPCKCRCI